MKLIISLLLALNFVNPTIHEKSVGDIKINMTVDDFKEVIKGKYILKEEIQMMEGEEFLFYHLYKEDNLVMWVEPSYGETCLLYRFFFEDASFKKSKGIGVGNTLGELKQKYTITKAFSGEGNIAVPVKEIGVSFLLDTSNVPMEWYSNQNKNQLDLNTKIETIIIF